jgi:Methyltransferase domain
LLNNDTVVIDANWLREMVSHVMRPTVGAVGVKLLYEDDTIQHAGVVLGTGFYDGVPGVAAHLGGYKHRDDSGYFGQYALTRELSACTGACLALRRVVYEEVGGLDEENLPVTFNDVDLCLRLRQSGYKIIWTPFAELYHLESASRGTDTAPVKAARFRREVENMRARWGSVLENDPFYNPNFSKADLYFSLALSPLRVKPWRNSILPVAARESPPTQSRSETSLTYSRGDGKIIEVGPSFKAVAAKSVERNSALDYASRERLDANDAGDPGKVVGQCSRLARLLPLLRCPDTAQALELSPTGDALISVDGSRRWPLVNGRPLLFPGLEAPMINSDVHLSNPLPASALAIIHSTSGPILHLSAGGTAERFEHVIEAEAAVFRHTDLICDSHRLPFKDDVFEAVIALNAFEHYRDPLSAAGEIRRVLQPGGCVVIHTAFLQPLHEAPWRFYNCTRYGLEAWFADFETERLHVSENFHPGYSLSWVASDCEFALRSHLSDVAADRFLATPLHQIVSLWRAPRGVKTADPLWNGLAALPQHVQEGLAAGFELIGRKPLA